MELCELTAYAWEKYHIAEEHKWTEHPGFSVLSHPSTGRCIALLMRIRKPGNSTEMQFCDIRCGRILPFLRGDYISAPFRMKGEEWAGVKFSDSTDPKTVYRLIDRAILLGGQNGSLIVLGSELAGKQENGYKDTPLPSASQVRPVKSAVPERIREMRRLYEYGYNSFQNTCRNFYIQGKFMEDFEDDAPWTGTFQHYFPTYHDLTTEQLRGYFTWRTLARKGEYREISTSFVYIYIYELLNGIGAASAEDSLEKLMEFERGYIDSGIGPVSIKPNLHAWMLDFAVVNGLSAETAVKYADKDMIRKDRAYHILRNCSEYNDDEVFDALFTFGGNKTLSSAVLKKYPEDGRHLFAEVWRIASANCRINGRKLFPMCFGECRPVRWHPLHNAVYYGQYSKEDRSYELDECRTYILKNGEWSVKRYRKRYFDKKRFEGLLQETDRRLRIYLKEGHPLKEMPDNRWAAEYIEAVIEEDRAEKQRAAARKVRIRFDDLDKIRRDALHTQNSLLTEEEKEETAATADIPIVTDMTDDEISAAAGSGYDKTMPASDDISSDTDKMQQIIDILLKGSSVKERLRSWGEMAEIFAERINEAYYDEIGDTVVECDGDDIVLIEDYREDMIRIAGGKTE